MPIIDLTTGIGPDAEYVLGVDLVADLLVPFALSSSLSLGVDLDSNIYLSNVVALAINDTFGPDIDPASVLRLGAEPNVFMSADAEIDVDLDPDAIIGIILELLGQFTIGIDGTSSTNTWSEVEISRVNFTVDIYEEIVFPTNNQEYKVRFMINDVEYPIEQFTIRADQSKLGKNVSVSLSRLTDRSFVVAGALYSIEIATVVGGVTTWIPINDGVIVTSNYSIGYQNNAPTDRVQLSTQDVMTNLMHTSPYSTTVLYDSSEQELTVDDFEPVFDMSGNEYPVNLIPIGNMTLYSIMSYCLAQAGINWNTDIPDFRIKRLDIGIGNSYFQAISGLIGVFEPLILERNERIRILDSSRVWPNGFGTPKQVTPTQYQSFQLDREFNDINGYVVEFTSSKEAWDSYEDKETEVINIIEDVDEAKVTTITTITYTRDYHRDAIPAVVVRSEVTKIETQIKVTEVKTLEDGTTYIDEPIIDETIEEFTYDRVGKLLTRDKHQWSRVPIWIPVGVDGHWEYSFEEVRYEHDESKYKDNKHKKETEYRETLEQWVRAMVYTDPDKRYEPIETTDPFDIDPDKEVPQDYKMEYVTAFRSGVLQDDGEVSFEPISSRIEKVIPVNSEMSRVETKEVDMITNITVVNVAEEQVGEISTNSQIPASSRVIVYGTGETRSSRRLETLNVGEVPIVQGIALARRKLGRRNNKNRTINMTIIGVDLAIDRGTVVNAIGRDNENLGNYMTEGWSIEGKALGTKQQTIMTSITGRET